MNESDARRFLEAVRRGHLSVEHALERLRKLPFEDLGFAEIDRHRSLRQGHPEVVFARGKTPREVVAIVSRTLPADASHNILITRAHAATLAVVGRLLRARGPRGSNSTSSPVRSPLDTAANVSVVHIDNGLEAGCVWPL
jgi:pyridinium-3,5-biscarboxylic acid mononucleotide synthase